MKRHTGALTIFGCMVMVAAGVYSYRAYHPADAEEVAVSHFPQGVTFYCVVVDEGDSLSVLDWYRPGKGFPPVPSHPADMSWSYDLNQDRGVCRRHPVKWKGGIRNGVITYSRDKTWRIYWVDGPPQTSFNLARLTAAALPQSVVGSLGLSTVEGLGF